MTTCAFLANQRRSSVRIILYSVATCSKLAWQCWDSTRSIPESLDNTARLTDPSLSRNAAILPEIFTNSQREQIVQSRKNRLRSICEQLIKTTVVGKDSELTYKVWLVWGSIQADGARHAHPLSSVHTCHIHLSPSKCKSRTIGKIIAGTRRHVTWQKRETSSSWPQRPRE